jgi:hypothetical protein
VERECIEKKDGVPKRLNDGVRVFVGFIRMLPSVFIKGLFTCQRRLRD